MPTGIRYEPQRLCVGKLASPGLGAEHGGARLLRAERAQLLAIDVEFVFGGSAIFTGIDWSAFDGVCAYSMFQMPEALTVPYGKQIHFALEGYVYPQDKEILETIWAMKRL